MTHEYSHERERECTTCLGIFEMNGNIRIVIKSHRGQVWSNMIIVERKICSNQQNFIDFLVFRDPIGSNPY